MRHQPIVQIGRGGMAEVLLALVHAGGDVGRLAVLKRIWPELGTANPLAAGPQPVRPLLTADGAPKEPVHLRPRHRRHHHHEDETLPPSVELDP